MLSRAPGAVAQPVDDETVVFVPGSGQVVVLDAIATRVWELLAAPLDLAELCERLAAEFGTTTARVAADLEEPYERLVTSGALVATVADGG